MDRGIRDLERRAATDPEAAAALVRERDRRAETIEDCSTLSIWRRFVGLRVYVEGARMNYVGDLLWVTAGPDGQPSLLVFSRLWRVGEWGRSGPDSRYTIEFPATEAHPQSISACAVDQGPGLMPWDWSPD